MELWEGAILVVGGVFLVGYMSQKNQAAVLGAQSAAAAATTINPNTGTTNVSNLTNLTNTAGGQPTVMGEPLEPPQAPIMPGGVIGPATTGAGGGTPPSAQMPANPVTPRGTIAAPVRGFLGSLSGQSNPALPATSNNPAAWGKFTPVARPIDVHL